MVREGTPASPGLTELILVTTATTGGGLLLVVENAKFWAFLAHFDQYYALFGVIFSSLNNVAV